jgi:uncharacterized protein YhbP (UPF0306 family)
MNMRKEQELSPGRDELRQMALQLIENQTTIALATTNPSTGQPWSAPVYYTFTRSSFYFVSNPKSRHIQESLDGAAAASLYGQASGWEDIRGLQMSGTIRRIPTGREAMQAVTLYLKKYPFTRRLFKPAVTIDANAFWEHFKVRLYAFDPDLVYYLDNQIRFGFRQEILLG